MRQAMTSETSTIFITGASAGIGEAIARRFAKQGECRLILAGRDQERLEKVRASLSVPAHISCFDVCDAQAVKNALHDLPAEFANIDVLVNNAGGALGLERAQDYELADWNAMVDVNIKGFLNVAHAALPDMVKRNRGHIVNMGSIAATYAYVGGNVYGATKAFVYQFSQNLRADLHGTNVRVTVIEPGLVETGFFKHRFKGDEKRASALFENIKALQPEDIAEAAYWCATLPPHVNINLIEVMPTCQAPAAIAIHRG
jgi:3-hydroxy acid dehydrogenase/malonic semialdehyde reductase